MNIKGKRTNTGRTHFKKGAIPWNKNRKETRIDVLGRQSISHLGPNPEHSKKMMGKIPWNKGKKLPQYSGEKNWNWKGGISPEREKIRSSIENKQWIRSIFSRDNFTCQGCGQRGGELTAHHINNFSQFPEIRFSIDNGITLCFKCHNEFHKRYGKQNNTKEQIIEFFTNQSTVA